MEWEDAAQQLECGGRGRWRKQKGVKDGRERRGKKRTYVKKKEEQIRKGLSYEKALW